MTKKYKYMRTEYRTLRTAVGTLLMWCNGTDNRDGRIVIGMRTEWKHNRGHSNAPVGGWDDVAETLTFGSTVYSAHDVAYIAPDGAIAHYDDALRRPLESGRWNDRPAPTHVAKFRAALDDALSAFLATDDGKAFVQRGAYCEANNDALRASEELAELDKKRAELRAMITMAERTMKRTAGALGSTN